VFVQTGEESFLYQQDDCRWVLI